jgi:hypothetical protein
MTDTTTNAYVIVKMRDLKIARDDMRLRAIRYRGHDCGFPKFADKWLSEADYILAHYANDVENEQILGDCLVLLRWAT